MRRSVSDYAWNGCLFTLIFVIILMIFNFVPFGSQTLLTVDLGQQYIDFYSLFRQTLLEDPRLILYSFQKAIGGEMFGLYAYYLLSPFNLILLFFKESQLATAVTLLTYLKLLTASLTMQYFIRQVYSLKLPYQLLMSLAYSLMSYALVFMLNIMWLDGLVFLPLIATGLHRIINKKSSTLYIVSLAWMMIANYYIAYMICLFLSVYAIYVISLNEKLTTWSQRIKRYGRFVSRSLLSVGLSAISLLPTIQALLSSKAANQELIIDTSRRHSLIEILSKLFIGAYNFDELSAGSPNLYFGIVPLIFVLLYFFSRHIRWQEKISAGIILFFFYLSFHFDALDLLWHGGQYPIWYHYRFSFVASFFAINLALRYLQTWQSQVHSLDLIIILLGLSGSTFYYFWSDTFDFLTPNKIYLTLLIAVLAILLLQNSQRIRTLLPWALVGLTTIDLTVNSWMILSENSYVSLPHFKDYITILDQSLTHLRPTDDEFYRIHTTFQRTKNEAMFAHYPGLDHFGSTIEENLPRLYGYLGLPDGSGFVNYSHGTLFTDDFFNVRYFVDPNPNRIHPPSDFEYELTQQAEDFDIDHYPIVESTDRYQILENPSRLGLGMEVQPWLLEAEFQEHQPIANQELLLQLINFDPHEQPFYTEHRFMDERLNNLFIADRGDGDFYRYVVEDPLTDEPATLNLTFDLLSSNPYYFTIPSQLTSSNSSLYLNGAPYQIYTPYRHRQITNAGFNASSTHNTLSLQLEEDEIQINPFRLYEFDLERYDQMIENNQQRQLEIHQVLSNQIKGQITTKEEASYLLLTIPYDSNWHATINGNKVEPLAVLNDTLLALPLTKGTHQIQLTYFPVTFLWGGLLSIGSLCVAFMLKYKVLTQLYKGAKH